MKLFLLSCLLYLLQSSEAKTYSNITRIGYGGTFAMFRVPRESVEKKVKEFNSIYRCDGGTLNLPNYQVLPEFLGPDEHVVLVGVGNITSSSFVDTLPCSTAEKYSLESPIVAFYIPFLTGPDPDDPPHFKLLTGSYVSTDKPFLNPNLAIPCEQVDEIVITDHGVTMKDGEEKFTASWIEKEDCLLPEYIVTSSIHEYGVELLPPFNKDLDFTACDPSDVQNVDICQVHEEVTDAMVSSGFNACEYWSPIGGYSNCQLESFTLDSISKKFAEVSLLYEAHTSPVVYEITHESQFASHMKIPCM